ncbi:MAG: glutamate racemase [Spirochaetales bacterium]|nr:glutamate racemase [Spirochaetales bacterium]
MICLRMNNAPIVFVDSGIGGLPYLEWLKNEMPKENFVYLADSLNFPYGTKDKKQVINIMLNIFNCLKEKYNPKAAVIACNTATVISLETLRKKFSFPIVGVVPAVKPAAKLSKKKRIGLMATNITINDKYTEKLIDDFASNCDVFRYSGTKIIDFIEKNLFKAETDKKKDVLQPAIDFFRQNDVDTIILGCTHFLLMEDELKELLGCDITVVDSREGVGRQIVRVLEKKDLLSDKKEKEDVFILTGEKSDKNLMESYKWITEKYGLCEA